MTPEFIAQTADSMPPDERMVWIEAQVEAGKVAGATFFRASVLHHDKNHSLTLVEGWSRRPDDQGEQRWQM